jgi:hypothetical protein
MKAALSTITQEQLQARFVELVNIETASSRTKAEAELLAEREVLHLAQDGELADDAVREFIAGLEKSRVARRRLKAIFDEMVTTKRRVGLTRIQAELVASRQLVRDAKSGQLNEDQVREFVFAIAVSHGISAEAAALNVSALFDGGPVWNNPTDLGSRQLGNEQVG